MTSVRYVVLSDLHLGASYSMLTNADPSGIAKPEEPPPTLSSLAAGFRSLIPEVSPDNKPSLVLLGDIFDLSFATPQFAIMAFQRLIEEFWKEPSVFSDEILYVPGNHDHRNWQTMRDAALLRSAIDQTSSEAPDELVTTGLTSDSFVPCELATVIARHASGNPNLKVVSGYPNVGLEHDGTSVVMHHGHYTESTYRLMSNFAKMLTGNPPGTDVSEIESLNGPWIDFGWSNSGDQGEIGPAIFNLYELIQDPAATHEHVRKIAIKLIEAASKVAPIRGSTRISIHGFEASVQAITEALLDLTLARAAQGERRSVDTVLSDSSVEGVTWYLAGPVRKQLAHTGWGEPIETPRYWDPLEGTPTNKTADHSGQVNFIFGHTHKPFQDQLLVPGFERPVQVWNTGGWVLDHPGLSPTQGAAAIFVDDEANVASLRLFNDPLDGSVGDVNVQGCHGRSDQENPLLADLSEALKANFGAWDRFSTDCLASIEQRVRLLRTRYFDPKEHPPSVGHQRRGSR